MCFFYNLMLPTKYPTNVRYPMERNAATTYSHTLSSAVTYTTTKYMLMAHTNKITTPPPILHTLKEEEEENKNLKKKKKNGFGFPFVL